MSHQAVLAALPDNKEEAKPLKEIALAIRLDISTHTTWCRAERSLGRVMRALIKWGWVESDRKQRTEGHRSWYNTYWMTELAKQSEAP